MTGPLWQPSEDRLKTANLTRFMADARDRWGFDGDDFAGLHGWSIANTGSGVMRHA